MNMYEYKGGNIIDKKHILGKEGEEIAEQYLISKGYEIIEKNFTCKAGEIDIIALDKIEYVFIEVKTRRNKSYGTPGEAVHNIKQKHLYKAVKYYVHIHNLENNFIRIDVIEVMKKYNRYKINHIKNAIFSDKN